MRPATETASVTLIPPLTIDCMARALPDKSVALNSPQDRVISSSSLAFISLSTSLPSGDSTPNKASLQASLTAAA